MSATNNAHVLIAFLRRPIPNPMHVNLARTIVRGLSELSGVPIPEDLSARDLADLLEGYAAADKIIEDAQQERARQAACN